MQILFDHPWFIVVNKPADLLTQAVEGIRSVQTSLTTLLRERQPDGPTPFVGVPHRLDRVTTGVMVLARNQRALKRLCEQFAARTVIKKYHALVESSPLGEGNGAVQGLVPTDEPQRWEDWIRKIPDVAAGEVCSPESEGARQAILYQRFLGHGQLLPIAQQPLTEPLIGEPLGLSASEGAQGEVCRQVGLLELELETGRMHQIRLQCASRGSPVVGDSLYGSQIRWLEGDYRQEPIALHARSIAFRHPQTGEKLEFEAPYPESWNRWHPHRANHR